MSRVRFLRIHDGHPERRMRGDEKSKKAPVGAQAAPGPSQQPELTDTPPARRVGQKRATETAQAAPETGEPRIVRRVRRTSG